jgi:hypothetical protein
MFVFRFFIGQLTALPLVIVGLTVLVQSHFSGHAILLFTILIAATWAIAMWAGISDATASLNQLVDFRTQFPHIALRPVPVSEYVAALSTKVPRLRSKRPDEILPFIAKLQRDRIRILVRSSAGPARGPLSPTLLTYASTLGAWMILADPPERLNGLGYFLLLHEIGHTALTSFTARMGITVALRNVIASGVFLAFLVRPTRMQAIALAVVAICWLPLAIGGQRFTRTIAGVLDEIIADNFALERSDPAWFKKYFAPDIIALFSRLESGSASVTPEEIQTRTHSFSQNLQRLVEGQPLLATGVTVPIYRWTIIEDLSLVTLMILFGLAHAPLSSGRLAMAAAASLLGVCLALLVGMIRTLERDLADDIMGVKPITPEKLLFLERAALKRKKLRSLVYWTRRNPIPPLPGQDVPENPQM